MRVVPVSRAAALGHGMSFPVCRLCALVCFCNNQDGLDATLRTHKSILILSRLKLTAIDHLRDP